MKIDFEKGTIGRSECDFCGAHSRNYKKGRFGDLLCNRCYEEDQAFPCGHSPMECDCLNDEALGLILN